MTDFRDLKGFTPGPWSVCIDDDGNPLSGRPSIQASDELDCAIVHWDGFVQEYWRSARGDKEIAANAELIAAAPDMHARLIELEAENARLRAGAPAVDSDLVMRVAKAIEGPIAGTVKFPVEVLREARWGMLTLDERLKRIEEAKRAVREIR